MFKSTFEQFPKNIADTFRGNNWVWHLIFISITYLLVVSGFDWWYFEHTRIPFLLQIAITAGPIGFFVPLLLPIAIYVVGKDRNDLRLQKIAAAVAQAGIIAVILSSAYKSVTGRFQPQLVAHPPLTVNISEAFHFGFLQNGLFWGWPSSHTTVAFAMAVTLVLLYRMRKTFKYEIILYAVFIGLAVSITIHWFSDFVAGAILGTLIAFVVAKNFKSRE